MSDASEVIEQGLRAWAHGDLDALEDVLDPAVTLRAAMPGSWDCEDREQVMRLLRERETERDPNHDRSVEVRREDEHTFVVSSTADDNGTATRVITADGKVIAMRQFADNQPATRQAHP